jgi:hypothetical protein
MWHIINASFAFWSVSHVLYMHVWMQDVEACVSCDGLQTVVCRLRIAAVSCRGVDCEELVQVRKLCKRIGIAAALHACVCYASGGSWHLY